MNIKALSIECIKAVMASKGYVAFNKEGIPNIVGIRSNQLDGEDFDDVCYVWWKQPDGNLFVKVYTITTNAGKHYLNNPLNANGCAILVPGQYIGCWILGLHGSSKQQALVQRGGAVKVYRDNNRNDKLDFDVNSIEEGYFGINIHHGSSSDADVIGKWSAGCQVWRYSKPHQDLMKQLQALSKKYGFKNFSYTLLEEKDFQ